MSKRVPLSTKPQAQRPPSAEEWVSATTPPGPVATTAAPEAASIAAIETETDHKSEAIKRLTIDIPASLHSRIKSQCALQGSKMADEIRILLEDRFPEA